MPRKFGNEIRLPGTTDIDNLPIPLTMTLSCNKYNWSQILKLYSSTCAIYKTYYKYDPLYGIDFSGTVCMEHHPTFLA